MTRRLVLLLMALIACGAARTAAQKPAAAIGEARHDGGAWDRAAAAKYLDDRMDIWFTNATKLRTGDDKATCVSCHSSIPYALARPALRRAMHTPSATAVEVRLIDDVTRRVDTYGTHQLIYETNDLRKTQSLGTEAVLNIVVLGSADTADGRREPREATRKALAHLWDTQRPDGAWDWLNFKLEPYETTDAVYHGATLAALGVGLVPGSARSEATSAGASRLRKYLRDNFDSQSLYNRTFALLASASFPDLVTRAGRDAVIAEFGQRRHPDGGWSLESMGPWRWSGTEPPFKPQGTLDAALVGQSDGFATGLIVYTLLRNGVRADNALVSAGIGWLKTHQQAIQVDDRTWTAWRAYSLNYDREHGGPTGEPWRRLFMSDAATAFAVLALTEAESR
jgi:squalene-hopene/tetraprenyl-beta-curcumene cyclase